MVHAKSYDIIDWKSCESYSPTDSSTVADKELFGTERIYPTSRDDVASTMDNIIFTKLFHEHRGSETSIVSIPNLLEDPLRLYDDQNNENFEQTVYQKVANWVLTQRNYFRPTELPLEDDEMEVIDPVDLFHESVLNDYLLITENESERRILLRDFEKHQYNIESIREAMRTNEYRFLRKPQGCVELELIPIKDFDKTYQTNSPKKVGNRKESISTVCSDVEKQEEHLTFLGVPRLLENYTILDREGYIMKKKEEVDIWLSPMEEGFVVEGEEKEANNFDIDFLSSWFSDVYQTDLNTDEGRTLFTFNTDIFEKVTVISVTNESEEEVWVDAPDIPHWFDDEQEELELFNQPSRPLYYYRDRIKGCYRIIGVEDETVVLFSGNDDDTIFYHDEETISGDQSTRNSLSGGEHEVEHHRQRYERLDSNCKNDSGIEDIDDITCEELAIASISISKEDAKALGYKTIQKVRKSVSFNDDNLSKRSFIDFMFVGAATFILVMAVLLSLQLHF